jgi:hypothetical protein
MENKQGVAAIDRPGIYAVRTHTGRIIKVGIVKEGHGGLAAQFNHFEPLPVSMFVNVEVLSMEDAR